MRRRHLAPSATSVSRGGRLPGQGPHLGTIRSAGAPAESAGGPLLRSAQTEGFPQGILGSTWSWVNPSPFCSARRPSEA